VSELERMLDVADRLASLGTGVDAPRRKTPLTNLPGVSALRTYKRESDLHVIGTLSSSAKGGSIYPARIPIGQTLIKQEEEAIIEELVEEIEEDIEEGIKEHLTHIEQVLREQECSGEKIEKEKEVRRRIYEAAMPYWTVLESPLYYVARKNFAGIRRRLTEKELQRFLYLS